VTAIVLLGCRGQVGWELQRSLAPLAELRCFDSRDIDLARPDALRATLRELRFDAIVNAAAYTAVDRAESEPQRAHAVNADAPGVLAEETAHRGAWLVHFSTDYVFDGSGDAPRDESAPTDPINAYGRSKLAGEQRVRASGCRHLILRTSWVYAARGDNFLRTMLRLAVERDTLNVVADQIGSPTGAELLADTAALALRAAMREPSLGGTYHVVPAGETSWHGYAMHAIAHARALGAALRIQSEGIEPVPSSAWPSAARRPLNSRLDTTKLRSAFGMQMPPWQAGVERVVAELLAHR
jgi:dTDP-4-dehydrorhamnose reductase